MEQKKTNTPISLRTVAGYFIFGVLWILLSDSLLLLFVPHTSPAYVTIQSIKGWLFVSLSALLIYFILKNDIRALETSETRLRGILNAAPDAMVILQGGGQIVLANQQVRQVFGYAPEELIGQGVDFLMPERFRTEHRRHQREFFHAPRHRVDPSMTLYGMRKDGREFPVNINLSHQTIDGELFVIAAIRDMTEWKAAEGILRESRELYQELFENNPQPMWVYDLETLAFKMVNDAAVAHYGYTREEFMSMTLKDIRPAEDVPALLANIDRHTQPLEKSSGWRHLKKDGTVIDVEISSHATEFNGRPARLVLANDVTERKQAEDALRESEELFRLTFENANIGVCLVGLDGRMLRVNQRMCDMLGYSRPVLEAMTVNSIAYPDDIDLSPRFMQQAASSPEKHGQFEKRYLHKQGHIIWGQVSSTLIQDQQGQPLYFISHVLDITDQKRAETALIVSEENYRSLAETSEGAIAVLDRDGSVLYVNPAGIRIWSDPQLVGKNVQDIFPAETAHRYLAVVQRVIDDQTLVTDELESLVNGRRMWFRISMSPLKNPDGSVNALLLNAWDVTETKQAERVLRESERRYRALFEDVPIAIFEEDFSESKKYLNALQQKGVTDLRAYFAAHPEEVLHCENLIRILDVNNTAVQMFEANSKEELLIATRQTSSKGELENSLEDMLAIAEGRTGNSWEGSDETLSGRQIEINLSWSVMPGHEEDYSKVIVTTKDITVRKQAEERLRLENERFLRFSNSNIIGIVIAEADGKIALANDYYLNLLGVSRADFEQGAVDWRTFTPPEWLAVDEKALHELAERGVCEPYEKEYVRADGSRIAVYIADAVLPGGQIAAFVLDITKRKEAEEDLKESEERFSTAFHTNPVSQSIITLETNEVVAVNDACCRLFGYPREELVGARTADLHLWANPAEEMSAVEELLREGRMHAREATIRMKSGELRTIIAEITPISWKGVPCLITSSFDITERKQAEEEVKALARFPSENPNPVMRFDTSGRLLYANSASAPLLALWNCAIGGYPPPEWKAHIESRTSRKLDLDCGKQVFSVIIAPVEGEAYVNLYARNITDRKMAEEELRLRNEDLLLINALNDAANRGEGIEIITEIFARETRKVFNCQDAAIYLLSPDGEYLEMQNTTVSPQVTQRIETMIGVSIPRIRLPVLDNGHIQTFLTSQEGNIIDDPAQIRAWIAEFTQTTSLPKALRPVVRKLVPQIAKLLNIRSLITVPLVSAGRVIGLMELSSRNSFSHEDLQRVRSISHQVTTAIFRKQAEANVERQIKRLTALNRIDLAINSGLDLRLSLDVVLNETLLQLGADAACILLLNKAGYQLEYMAGKGFRSAAITQTQLRLGEGYAGRVGLGRKTLHIPDLEAEAGVFIRKQLLQKEDFVEYFGVPLVAKGELKGVLEVFNRSNLHPDPEWLNYLETLGGQAAIAIDNLQMFEGLQQSNQELVAAYDATIAGWSHAMDLRDKETEGHTQRVTDLTVRLAKRMNVSQKELIHIRRGALLHDIGKLGVPDQILLKPGKLTDEEWTIMRRHPTYAYEMLLPIYYLKPALDIPYCHHEKWDGSGYPRGLKGEQIPLSARIFAIVDVWDALRSDRPYRPGWELERIREYILEQSGKHFDPHVVEAFMELMGEGE